VEKEEKRSEAVLFFQSGQHFCSLLYLWVVVLQISKIPWSCLLKKWYPMTIEYDAWESLKSRCFISVVSQYNERWNLLLSIKILHPLNTNKKQNSIISDNKLWKGMNEELKVTVWLWLWLCDNVCVIVWLCDCVIVCIDWDEYTNFSDLDLCLLGEKLNELFNVCVWSKSRNLNTQT
jgi:hypothetical protein